MDTTTTPAIDPTSYFLERIAGMRCERCGEPAAVEYSILFSPPEYCWFCDDCSEAFYGMLDDGQITTGRRAIARSRIENCQLVSECFWPGDGGASKLYAGMLWESV